MGLMAKLDDADGSCLGSSDVRVCPGSRLSYMRMGWLWIG